MAQYKVYVESRIEEVYLVEADSDQEARDTFYDSGGVFLEEVDRDIFEINEVKQED